MMSKGYVMVVTKKTKPMWKKQGKNEGRKKIKICGIPKESKVNSNKDSTNSTIINGKNVSLTYNRCSIISN